MELCQIRYDGSDLLREALKGSSAISLSASMNVSGGISSAAINQGNNTSGSSSSTNNASSGGDGEDGKGPKSGESLPLPCAPYQVEKYAAAAAAAAVFACSFREYREAGGDAPLLLQA